MRRILILTALIFHITSGICLAGMVRLVLGDLGVDACAKAVYMAGDVHFGTTFFAPNGRFVARIKTHFGDFDIPVEVREDEETVVELPLPHGFDRSEFLRMTRDQYRTFLRWDKYDLTYAVVQETANSNLIGDAVGRAFSEVAKQTGLFRFVETNNAESADFVIHLISYGEMSKRFGADGNVPLGMECDRPTGAFFNGVDIFLRSEACHNPTIIKHEIGHGLGLVHSAKPINLMCVKTRETKFSAEELTFLRVLYSM